MLSTCTTCTNYKTNVCFCLYCCWSTELSLPKEFQWRLRRQSNEKRIKRKENAVKEKIVASLWLREMAKCVHRTKPKTLAAAHTLYVRVFVCDSVDVVGARVLVKRSNSWKWLTQFASRCLRLSCDRDCVDAFVLQFCLNSKCKVKNCFCFIVVLSFFFRVLRPNNFHDNICFCQIIWIRIVTFCFSSGFVAHVVISVTFGLRKIIFLHFVIIIIHAKRDFLFDKLFHQN